MKSNCHTTRQTMGIPTLIISWASLAAAWAGPFANDIIPAADTRFTLWATGAEITRGLTDIAFDEEPLIYATYGDASSATGPANGSMGDEGNPYPVVSLGDGGSATLTFASPLADISGPDFAVFENSFNGRFLELAHVEVSSDGVVFFRFPSISLTQTDTQITGYGTLDPTNLHNLAGKAPGGSGTPFDLSELKHHHPVLDIQRITHVRVVDVVGSLAPEHPEHRTLDSLGNTINDPYPTDHEFSGFDLDAVGAFQPMISLYQNWTASRNLSGNDALPTADPDHDGIPNFITYLTGGDIITMEPSTSETTLRFTRLAYRTDGKLRVESASKLGDWETLAESSSGGLLTAAPGSQAVISEVGAHLVQVTLTVPATTGKRFFRLAAEP